MFRFIYIFLVSILSLQQASAQVLWNLRSDTSILYYYVDGDEFGSDDLPQKWQSSYGWARSIASNKEQQYYSEYKNHEIKDGCLHLTVEKKHVNARLVDWLNDRDTIRSGRLFNGFNKRNFKYSAGMIASKKQYLKGYFEMKFRAPKEAGLWPAFWLYGGTPNEEIDFMEIKGERENQLHVDTHCPNRCDDQPNAIGIKKNFGGWIRLNGRLNEGFNVVSGVWDDESVKFYLNGRYIAEAKVKFNQPKALVANIAVPSNDGPFHPGPDSSLVRFSPMSIDYIRVWSRDKSIASTRLISAESEKPLMDAKMKRRVRFLYGQKKAHKNEGIFVSLMRGDDNTLTCFCNGLEKNESFRLLLQDNAGKVLFEKEVKERELKIPVNISAGTKLGITYKGHSTVYVF